MPRYQFPITPDGLPLPVYVGPDQQVTNALVQAGFPVPVSLVLSGLIDTGTDVTCISPAVAQHFRFPPALSTKTQTASASVPVNLCHVGIGIPALGGVPHPTVWNPRLLVMELPRPVGYDVLVGMDLLLTARLTIDGPNRTFTLDI